MSSLKKVNVSESSDVEGADVKDDAVWVEKARAGDPAGWAELHFRYYGRLWSAVNQVLNDAAAAEDAVQEAFIKAFRNIHRFRGGSKFSTWIYRIALNQAFDTLRKRNRSRKWLGFFPLEPDDEEAPVRQMAAPELSLSGAERTDCRKAVARALKSLPAAHRAVVELRLVQGLSTEETARVLGCKKGTVLSRLFYSCQKLQPLLKGVYEEL